MPQHFAKRARTHTLRLGLRVGVWLPAHVTSGGRALLADLSDDDVDARYKSTHVGPRAHGADVDLATLHEQLAAIRRSRIAWNFEESQPGVAAMSISVGEFGGERVALSIALPAARYTRELGGKWAQNLIDVADAIRAENRSHDAS